MALFHDNTLTVPLRLLKSWIHQGRHRAQPPESTLEATSPSDNLDEATRTLQKLFFGDQMPAGQVPRPVEDDVVKDNGSDIESDYAKGIDLATSCESLRAEDSVLGAGGLGS